MDGHAKTDAQLRVAHRDQRGQGIGVHVRRQEHAQVLEPGICQPVRLVEEDDDLPSLGRDLLEGVSQL